MTDVIEDIYRFNGLGLWAILIALILFGLRQAAKRIENQNILNGVFILGISCLIAIGIIIYNFEEQKENQKENPKKINSEEPKTMDTVVQITKKDTTTYASESDSTRLTLDFMKGTWKVISVDKNSPLKATLKFGSVTWDEKFGSIKHSRKKLTVESKEWLLKVQPTSELSLSSFVSQDNKIKLYIKRVGSRMEGELEVKQKKGVVDKNIEIKIYYLTFTKE